MDVRLVSYYLRRVDSFSFHTRGDTHLYPGSVEWFPHTGLLSRALLLGFTITRLPTALLSFFPIVFILYCYDFFRTILLFYSVLFLLCSRLLIGDPCCSIAASRVSCQSRHSALPPLLSAFSSLQ